MQDAPQLASLLAGDVVNASRCLLGCMLQRRMPDRSIISGRIVETEAYHQREPGCHAFKGRTARTETMFGPPGTLYVYLIYGMYHCANVVCEPEGTAAAVLIRALEPVENTQLRCQGPGLLCKALELDRSHDGLDLLAGGEVRLLPGALLHGESVESSRRIGFSFEDELDWRFHIKGNPWVSKGKPGKLVKRSRK